LPKVFPENLLPKGNDFFEISRGSLIEIDTALDIAMILDYVKEENLAPEAEKMIRCFQMLSKMINS